MEKKNLQPNTENVITKQSMRFSCCLNKAKDTQNKFLVLNNAIDTSSE